MTKKPMPRTVIQTLTLINFNGISFSNLDLDGTTTALEGRNGAGKTTTMIGCYLPLMPDQAFLEFKNISDNGDQTKRDSGIYDRFGSYADVAYSVLKFKLGNGAIFYAGIEVKKLPQRKYELTPFTITDVPVGIPPEELLMLRDTDGDHFIKPLTDLGPHIISMGGNFRKYAKLTDYFSVLFENGISPTILTTRADRGKLHKLMMASFYGGLTADLQKSIKDYLLPENNDVKTSVDRARDLLNEVRTTKQTIERAQVTFAKVQKIDTIAFDMMASAFYSLRNEKDVAERDRRRALVAMRSTIERYRSAQHALAEATEQWEKSSQSLVEANTELAQAGARLAVIESANKLAHEIDQRTPEVEALHRAHEEASEKYAIAQEAEREAAFSRTRLLDDQVTLGQTLGNARKAFEDISRKVGLYNGAQNALADVRKLLANEAFDPDDAQATRKKAITALDADRQAREPARRKVQLAQDTQLAFAPIYAAVQELVSSGVTPADAYRVGHNVLTMYRGFEQSVASAVGIHDRIRTAEQNASRQKRVRQALADLAQEGQGASTAITTSEQLRSEIEKVSRQIDEHNASAEAESTRFFTATKLKNEKELAMDQLEADLAQWREAQQYRAALREAGGMEVENAAALRNEEVRVEESIRELQAKIDNQEAAIAGLERRIAEIQDNGSRIDERLSQIADRIDGKLVAELYDDVSIADAARIEASMGPLVRAIMVPNIRKAATTLSLNAKTMGEVWLISEDEVSRLPEAETIGEMCVVQMGNATRIAPVPTRPILGRTARQAEVKQLMADIEALTPDLAALRGQFAAARKQRDFVRALLPYSRWLDQPSPVNVLAEVRVEIESVTKQISAAERRRRTIGENKIALEKRLRALNECNLDAALLDGEDWNAMVNNLAEQQLHATECQRTLSAGARPYEVLKAGLETLRAVPISAEEIQALEMECDRLDRAIDTHNNTIYALDHLIDQARYFAYADQVALEQQETGVLQQLESQAAALAVAVQNAETARQAASEKREECGTQKSDDYGKWSALAEWVKQRRSQLEQMNCPSDDESLARAQAKVDGCKERVSLASEVERALLTKRARIEGDVNNERASLVGPSGAISEARNASKSYRSTSSEWTALDLAVLQQDPAMHARLFSNAVERDYLGHTPKSQNDKAVWKRQELHQALTDAGAGILFSSPSGTRYTGHEALGDWLVVRKYLEQSLPRDITQSDDISHALADITSSLEDMRQRQQEQESKFRTSAESISNSINNLIRREILNINRINNDKRLADVRFGSITGVQIKATRIEHMVRFLDALREENDLFSDDRSLEDALAFLYERTGGGSAQGAALLDYRKYIQINIQVTRLGQSTWDSNIGSSSGESIGVGAAILVVILDAMERQSEALQRRKVPGSIRFLMLDEANRLDSTSMEMMSAFCLSMGVQLLVAAPEIAKARSGTTYCLVRRATEQGQEVEVTYRGRRGYAPETAE